MNVLDAIWHMPGGFATLLASLFALCAAIFAWRGVQQQMRSSQRIAQQQIGSAQAIEAAKVRLALYDRRFRIYESIFDFYDALLDWKATPEQREAQRRFFRAYQEAGFLFSKDSGIEDALKHVHEGSASVIGFKEYGEHYRAGGTQFYLEQYNKMNRVLITDFDDALKVIKPAIARYLNFHTIEG